jgi:arylsulfatase A
MSIRKGFKAGNTERLTCLRSCFGQWGKAMRNLIWVLIVGWGVGGSEIVLAGSPTRPNVVIIYADDLGYGDVQCYNRERGKIATPHIDRLAAQGMRFTDGHSSSGVCSPSRYTLLTGRYHWRTRLQSGIVGLWGPPLIQPDRLTVANLAQQHGYRTACIGKWHLGWDWPIPEARAALFKQRPRGSVATSNEQRAVWREVFSQPIGGGPTARGFHTYFGTDVPNWPPFCFIENDRTMGIPSQFLPAELLGNQQASNQGPALKDWKLESILPTLVDRAEVFIAESSARPEPYFLYLPLTSPHTPLAVNEAWRGRSGLHRYADFVMETDAAVGQVLQAVEKSGEAENTLVLFTSDNGCAPYIGVAELEQKGHFSSGPLRGYKSDAWEGGHRVPFIVRWPQVVKPGSECHQLVHQADLIATLADMLETKLPADAGEDSFSLLPLLQGHDQPVRLTAVSCSVQGLASLRSGDWKYIAGAGSGGWSKGGEPDAPVQLYHLAEDLGETNNLAKIKPEKLAELQAMFEEIISRGRSTPGEPQSNDVPVRRFAPRRAG